MTTSTTLNLQLGDARAVIDRILDSRPVEYQERMMDLSARLHSDEKAAARKTERPPRRTSCSLTELIRAAYWQLIELSSRTEPRR